MKQITTTIEWEAVKEQSKDSPLVLFKHSTRCPVSSFAHRTVASFESNHADVSIFMVNVITDKELSNFIARESGVRHESPQVLVLHKGKVTHHDSHFGITKGKLEQWCTNS